MSSLAYPLVQEPGLSYSSSSKNHFIFEICLRAKPSSGWLKELPGAHRLVQALLQGQLLGLYELLDFIVWPEGLLTRISLRGTSSLSEFLKFLKERTVPAGEPTVFFWEDEPLWIKLIGEDQMDQSTLSFFETAERLIKQTGPSLIPTQTLFFFYRDPRLLK